MKKIFPILLFSFLISIPVILPFFHPGYFPTHDGEWAVVRLGDMFRTLRDFQIPPRYSGALNFGYGYPLFNFTYPTPYYLGTFIHFLGFGFVDTIKILFAISVPLSAFFMFLASRKLWKNTSSGIVSAILYVYFPYRMVDLYIRGSIGESLAFVLFPLLFYLIIKLIEKSSYLWVLGIGISLAVLVTTHNIMTVLFLPVWILFTISKVIFDKKKDSIKFVLVSIFLGIGISAFFWLPALFEKHLIFLSQSPIADRSLYFVKLHQLLQGKWGYGVPTDISGFTYQLGLAHLIVLILTIFSFLFMIRRSGKSKRFQNLYSYFLLIAILIYIFLLLEPSVFLWENLPLLSEINYPWIALGILGFLSSLLAGFLCRQKITKYIAILLGIISIIFVLPYAKPQYFINKGDDYYLTNHATTTSSNELMPLWVKKFPALRFVEKIKIAEGQGKVENVSYNSKQISFSVDLKTQSTVRINTIYYPGWKVNVDNQSVPISYTNEQGVMDISIVSGKHLIKANFTETPLRATSNVIFLLSLFALLFITTKTLRKSRFA